jgi:hypothetical protein
MKLLVVISTLLVAANSMPRYLIVPIENVRFLNPAPQQTLHRVTRSAWPQEEQQQQFVFSPNAASPQFSQRRQGEG